jgi:nucleoside-diphosphate-sugar epimerase
MVLKGMKVLFIGGTGIISSACSQLAIDQGVELFHLNRGISSKIRKVDGVKTLIADIRNPAETEKALDGYKFDVVVDWVAFEPEHIKNDIKLFNGKTGQFIFISSASAYQTPPAKLPVTEETPLENSFWQYSRNKIACENALLAAGADFGFPATIVRPSHTYDKTTLPLVGGYTALHRMKHGLPVIVHGDGTSLWTLTHHKDFAKGFVGLFGNKAAIGEAFHITSDEWLSWNAIYTMLASAWGVDLNLVHIPSVTIAKHDQELGAGLLGDKMHSMIFDNSKIKKFVPEFNAVIPFEEGVKEIVEWYKMNDSNDQVNHKINAMMDQLAGI